MSSDILCWDTCISKCSSVAAEEAIFRYSSAFGGSGRGRPPTLSAAHTQQNVRQQR